MAFGKNVGDVLFAASSSSFSGVAKHQTLNLNIAVLAMLRKCMCVNDRNPASPICARNIETGAGSSITNRRARVTQGVMQDFVHPQSRTR